MEGNALLGDAWVSVRLGSSSDLLAGDSADKLPEATGVEGSAWAGHVSSVVGCTHRMSRGADSPAPYLSCSEGPQGVALGAWLPSHLTQVILQCRGDSVVWN